MELAGFQSMVLDHDAAVRPPLYPLVVQVRVENPKVLSDVFKRPEFDQVIPAAGAACPPGHQIRAEGTACFSWRVNSRSPLSRGSILVVVKGAPRESLNLRVPPELKAEVEAYAEVKGVSINAAAILLLAEGLRVERRRR